MMEELYEDDTLEDSWDIQSESTNEQETQDTTDEVQETDEVLGSEIEDTVATQEVEPEGFAPLPLTPEVSISNETAQEHPDVAETSEAVADTSSSSEITELSGLPTVPGESGIPSDPGMPSGPTSGPNSPSPTGDSALSARDQMTEYLSSHNYGREDFSTYCQDPEWQRLNNQLLQEQEIPPTAADQMSLYMAEHNYSQMDYPTYSQDPEWQRINEAYKVDPDMRIPVTPYENRIDAVLASSDEGQELPAYETLESQSTDVSPQTETLEPQSTDVSPQTETLEPQSTDVSPQAETLEPQSTDVNPQTETLEPQSTDVNPQAETLEPQSTDVSPQTETLEPQSTDVSLQTETLEPQSTDVNPQAETREPQSTDTKEPVSPLVDSQEGLTDEISQNAEGFYKQGDNDFGFEGTCGPTSVANGLNQLLGENRFSENDVLTQAVNENLCFHDSNNLEDCGSTTTEEFVQLYEHMGKLSGENIQVDTYEFDDVLSMEEVAQKLEEGCIVTAAVDSRTLWGENVDDAMGTPSMSRATDHWITVTKAERGEDGSITGFEVIDSGGGVSYVDAETYQRMCYGDENLHLTDPTCVVAQREMSEGTQETATAETGEFPADVEPSGEKIPVLQESSEFFAGMDAEDLARNQAAMEKLDPDEQAVYFQALRDEPAITQDVCRIAENSGGQAVGLEHRVKLPDSLEEKLHERGDPMDIHEVSDILRYTQTFPPETLTQGVNDSLALYEQKGYEVVQVKNTWSDTSNPYNGINVKLISPSHQKLEVQFHTPESYEVKNGPMHKLYEEWRKLPEDSDEAIVLQNQMFALSRQIAVPRNISEVKNR